MQRGTEHIVCSHKCIEFKLLTKLSHVIVHTAHSPSCIYSRCVCLFSLRIDEIMVLLLKRLHFMKNKIHVISFCPEPVFFHARTFVVLPFCSAKFLSFLFLTMYYYWHVHFIIRKMWTLHVMWSERLPSCNPVHYDTMFITQYHSILNGKLFHRTVISIPLTWIMSIDCLWSRFASSRLEFNDCLYVYIKWYELLLGGFHFNFRHIVPVRPNIFFHLKRKGSWC